MQHKNRLYPKVYSERFTRKWHLGASSFIGCHVFQLDQQFSNQDTVCSFVWFAAFPSQSTAVAILGCFFQFYGTSNPSGKHVRVM